MIRVYYFGCWDRPGHFLHDTDGYHVSRPAAQAAKIPLDDRILDRHFAPPFVQEDETQTALTHIHGWTVLAMWDRSVDTRSGCNAAFLVPGTYTTDQMWHLAKMSYPQIVARLKAAPKDIL